MTTNHADPQSSASDRPIDQPIRPGMTSLQEVDARLFPYGRGFCQFTKTDPSEVDWKAGTMRLIGIWMRSLQDMQVSDSGWALFTAYFRLDSFRAAASTMQLVSQEVAYRMEHLAKRCFIDQGRRLAAEQSPDIADTLVVQGSFMLDVQGSFTLDQKNSLLHGDVTVH